MAYTKVGVGTVANDNTGDPIRTAFQTLNANLVLLDTTFASSNALIIGDDPANLGTPTGFENTISSADASNDDITIAPDGSGNIILDTATWPNAFAATTGFTLVSTDAGILSWVARAQLVDDLSPVLGANLDVGAFDIVSAGALDITITPDTTGEIVLDGLQWPQADGSVNEALTTDGAGQLAFVAVVHFVTATTAELADITDAINTGADKIQGYQVYNTTADTPVWAADATDGGLWNFADGTLAHTPV